jgi:hypothetical protein
LTLDKIACPKDVVAFKAESWNLPPAKGCCVPHHATAPAIIPLCQRLPIVSSAATDDQILAYTNLVQRRRRHERRYDIGPHVLVSRSKNRISTLMGTFVAPDQLIETDVI